MKRPALGHILGYTTLTVVLTAGAAQSLSSSNTVFSDDIVDGNVTSADIKDQSVLYADIKDGAMTGKKILDNSITGADVNESTLNLNCRQGSVAGWARFRASASIPADGVQIEGAWTCSGSPAWVKRIGVGHYSVCFADVPEAESFVFYGLLNGQNSGCYDDLFADEDEHFVRVFAIVR